MIRSNRRLGAILIITPDHGHLYLLVPQIIGKNPSLRKFKGSECDSSIEQKYVSL